MGTERCRTTSIVPKYLLAEASSAASLGFVPSYVRM
jgi:hypothetical protein